MESEISTPVRTRFAPSPTGYLHVGGARTAFFCYLLAKRFGGQFLLRIEDTDQERLVPGAIGSLLREFEWLQLMPDEGPSHKELAEVGEDPTGLPHLSGPFGPYIQSLRRARYKEVAEKLVSSGFAYRCDCTPEMLEKERLEQMARKELPGYSGYCRDRNLGADKPHVIRFRMPEKKSLTLIDAVKGRVTWESISLRDTVILKSDGLPTYHLAVVVDDHEMRITHAMRGDEWLSSCPLHLLIYEALGWVPPVFAHLPVILGADGKKLSKRDGAVFTSSFRERGYLPQALLNYVTLIGWSAGEGEEQEVYTKAELESRFSLERLNNASGVFDYNKLDWMNGVYIRNLSDEDFVKSFFPYLHQAQLEIAQSKLLSLSKHVKERVKLLTEVPAMLDFLRPSLTERDLEAMFQKGIDSAKAKDILEAGSTELEKVSNFDHSSLEATLRPLAEKFGIKAGPLFMIFRIAVTGKKITPPLFESMEALGKAKVMERITETIGLLG